MPNANASTALSPYKPILVPGLITLAVTLLRLGGELMHWSPRWFSATPYGAGTLVGISWLAPVFGIYFALRLLKAGERPQSLTRTLGLALLAVALFLVTVTMGGNLAQKNFMAFLILFWGLAVVLAGLQYPGWPALFKVLLVYGLAARVPVAAIMFFAMRGQWGTHYDWIQPLFPYTGFWAKWVGLALIPQLTIWVGFTIVAGTLFGSLAAAVAARHKRASQVPSHFQ